MSPITPPSLSRLLLILPGLLLSLNASAGSEYGKRFPARWLEHEGRIRLDTVCYNYPQQSYMYPLCRLQAVTRLEKRCTRYRTSLQQATEFQVREHFRVLTDKYCSASEEYRHLLVQNGLLQE